MSIHTEGVAEREYAAGVSDGRLWAEQDVNEGSHTYWIETLQGECETFRTVGSRGVRAYYLGALRGYRESTRTLREGRWTT